MPGLDAGVGMRGQLMGTRMTNDALEGGTGKDLPAGFMGEGVGFGLHLRGYRGPADALQITILDDGQEQVLVGLVVPLRRHVVV